MHDDEAPDSGGSEAEEEEVKPQANNVANILKRLQSSGALIKKPKQEFRCYTCDEDFRDWEELENHIIQHVSLPSVVLVKLPSDDEDEGSPSGDEHWSDEEEEVPPPKAPQKVTPTKIDISQLLKKGISVKKPVDSDNTNDSALNKLSGLGFTIKKSNTPIKSEPEQEGNANDVMKKLGKLGGIKLKLKSDGNNTNSFKVINGLKDFNASDDEEQESGNEDSRENQDFDEEPGDNESDGENEQSPPNIRKTSESDDSEKSAKAKPNSLKSLQGVAIKQKEPPTPIKVAVQQNKPPGRPAVKQTPKRGANLPLPATQEREVSSTKSSTSTPSSASTPERRESHSSMDNVVVKQEVEAVETQSSNVPIFSTQHQIKSERASPPAPTGDASTPILAKVKSEPDALASHQNAPNNSVAMHLPSNNSTPSLLPITKKEEPSSVTVIEINGDSNDEDDDCCVVSATPAPDIKPVVPKTENPPVTYPPPAYPTTQGSYSSSNMLNTRLTAPSTEKQHNFNWNAPDSKPPLDMLEKSADDIFGSLLSSNSAKKETMSISDASEYISLDTLGPQHSCDVCNTRFTDLALLDDHRRMTGHTKALVLPASSSTLMPYNSSSNILSSILPVKQIADQVGKLSTISGSGPGFTHQQNVMINIQAYPGAGGMMMNPQGGYNSYQSAPNVQPDYGNNMYGQPQQMPGQYPGQNYMGQQNYGQFQQPMNKPAPYPNTMQQGQFPPSSSPYSSTPSPLQGMQQAVYGQAPSGGMNVPMGQQPLGHMGPPGAPYVPSSSPGGAMKPPTGGVKIQNVQTFHPGQQVGVPGSEQMPGPGGPAAPGPIVAGQMPGQTQIRMAPGANITRPRMANPRGPRPAIRPGIQVHGQVRGQKPGVRMPMKRPAQMAGGPTQKRRTDMLLPGKHDNEDCQVMALQKQREGLPMIHSVQGAKDKFNLGSQISITKKTVNKEANAMANVLASRGISVKQKPKSRSPSPERPAPYIPNLGAGVSIKHTSKSSKFSIPEAKVGGGLMACKICKNMFMNHNSLAVHMANAHPQSKVPVFKCDECPASYPKSLQLQHHKRVFHNVTGPNRELGLPVVDLSQEDNLKRLSSLGIYSFIPLANREQAGGCFGIPVISVHNAQNGTSHSLQALGADGLLSLGPLKPLPNS
ncbi:hypothetical protein HF086_007703 [Spodoptera exigua]|uniref:C2H2-type domain-containing protein n=1 Tax=Spodoptera exigua TaxID=7107 RepID=A0A922MFF4_SPOEX|nr:hypothetical protein HF086_007703 [Spodoptera exigua]